MDLYRIGTTTSSPEIAFPSPSPTLEDLATAAPWVDGSPAHKTLSPVMHKPETPPPVIREPAATPAPITLTSPPVTEIAIPESEEPNPTPARAITGASCTSMGTVAVNSTIVVKSGKTFDGECMTFEASSGIGDGGQSEGQDPVFRLEDGATLKNVIIGVNGADGVHTYGDATVDNVVWIDIGKDGLTVKGEDSTVMVTNISAYNGEDKFFLINAPSTVRVENAIIMGAWRILSQNGGTDFKIDVAFVNCKIHNVERQIFNASSSSSVAIATNIDLKKVSKLCNGAWAECSVNGVRYGVP